MAPSPVASAGAMNSVGSEAPRAIRIRTRPVSNASMPTRMSASYCCRSRTWNTTTTTSTASPRYMSEAMAAAACAWVEAPSTASTSWTMPRHTTASRTLATRTVPSTSPSLSASRATSRVASLLRPKSARRPTSMTVVRTRTYSPYTPGAR